MLGFLLFQRFSREVLASPALRIIPAGPGSLALRHQHVAHLVVADREVALPLRVSRIARGQRLGDDQARTRVRLRKTVKCMPGRSERCRTNAQASPVLTSASEPSFLMRAE